MLNAPSLTGLRAFDAVIRYGSLTGAARELCVTPAAVSHRLKDLEDRAGSKLIYRENGIFYPTAHGRAVLEELGDAFERIRSANRLLEESAAVPSLHIVASYSFAVMWLIPNLPDFQARHPDVQISIEPSHSPVRHSRAETNLTIVHAVSRPEGSGWHELFSDVCAVICKTGHPLLKQAPPLLPEQLCDYPLVHISHDQGSRRGEFSWLEWGQKAFGSALQFPVGLRVTAEHAAIDVVQTNQSLALASLINSERFLQTETLRFISQTAVPSGRSYWMRAHEIAHRNKSSAREFQHWLKTRVAESAARFETVSA